MEPMDVAKPSGNSIQEFSTDLLRVYYGEFVSSD
jgi:hypothetical protein